MASAVDFYSPPPDDVPPDLTKPSSSYRARVLLVLSSLLLFVVLYIGLVVGSAYLCYWSFATLGSGETSLAATRSELDSIGNTQRMALDTYNNAVQRVQLRAIDNNQLAQIVERDVLPPWRDSRQRLANIKNVPIEAHDTFQQFVRYTQLREEGLDLLCRSIRQNNQQLANLSNQMMQEADNLAKQMSTQARFPTRPPPRPSRGGDGAFWKVILGIISALLCLFLVKGFFKRQRIDTSLRVEVKEEEQPELFGFIRRLCKDTRAPLPHRIYLTADVNASVFYQESVLSLFLPTPKNLIIGLGLVNRVNLSEFKAVLAHEFGHFSQSSMKLGSYVYTSNRVICDLVFGRDWLDNVVAALRGTDIRIAIFAWGFTGILWGLRKGLQGLFKALNFANSALSRQMEFNADLVAVSVTGSDALIHGLARLDLAVQSLDQAWFDLNAAADHQLFSRDLFYHQTRAADYLRGRSKDPRWGEPPPLPKDARQTVQVFQPEDTSVPKMWATHPSNHDREVNAKAHYIRSPIDGRSPWCLFDNGPAVRETVTRQLYLVTRNLDALKLKAPEVVQAFIDEEHAETTFDPRYHGFYGGRYLTPGDLDELSRSAANHFPSADALAQANARLYADELKYRMDAHQTRLEESNLLGRLLQGAVELRGKDFQFRGNRHPAADAQHLLDMVQKELDQDFAWMGGVDRQVFLVYHEMARQAGGELLRELEQRYRFQLALQDIHGQLSAQFYNVNMTLSQIAGRPQLSKDEFDGVVGVLWDAHTVLSDKITAAKQLYMPALKNVSEGAPLSDFLSNRPLIRRFRGDQNSLDGEWIKKFLDQMAEVMDRVQRLHFKSIGGIVALQERIAVAWAK